ncbi:MAG: DUF58 domain-containing protein [Candidatus Nanoarchaeia archaeon]
MIETDFLHQLDKFSVIFKKKVTSSFTGERRTALAGSGLLFRDHVAYGPGADFKHIDWKVYSRTDKLVVKRFEEDRNLTVHVLVDFSGSMNFGNKLKKYEYASMIGLGFVYIALKNNEKFVLSTFDGKLDLFKPKKGARQVVEILAYLNKKKPEGTTDIEQSLIQYKHQINSRSLIVIISDFFYDVKAIKNLLHRLKRNQVKLIQVLDPLEKNFKLEGDYNLVDLESEETLRTYIDPHLRKVYLEKMETHRQALLQACDETGAQLYQAVSDEDVFDLFYRILN